MPWLKMLLRDAVVYARVKADGTLALEPDGRVAIKYRLGEDQKIYRANAKNLSDAPGAREVVADAAPAPASAFASATGGTAGAAATAAPSAPVAAGTVIIYGDGACTGNPGPMGLGAVVMDGTKRLEISEYLGEGTNNIAELNAVLRALEAADHLRERPIKVHTDSQYTIGILSKGWKAKANQELVAKLRKVVARFPHIRFEYVRGHSGIPENERCDELARDAIVTRTTKRTGSV